MVAGEEKQMEKIAEGIYKITYQKPEPFTPVSMRKSEMDDGALERMGKGRKDGAAALLFEETEIQFEQTARGITVTLPMKTDEDICGQTGGEHTASGIQ